MADWFVAADVVRLAVAPVAGARPQECVSRVIHVDKVANLRTVAVDLNGPSLERQTDEPPDESLAVVADQLPRAVDIREAKRAGADAEHVVVDQMVLLARRLVDAVHVGRTDQV